MTVNNSRSLNGDLDNGCTDGKYRKARPDTNRVPGVGDEIVENNRQDLHPFWQYGYVTSDASGSMVNPGKG